MAIYIVHRQGLTVVSKCNRAKIAYLEFKIWLNNAVFCLFLF